MDRRGFLAGILACGVAPYVMSGAVGAGVLMPVRTLWTPPMCAGVINLFSTEGVLLAAVPISLTDGILHGSPMGQTVFRHTGIYEHATLTVRGRAVPIDFRMLNPTIMAGDSLTVAPFRLTQEAR